MGKHIKVLQSNCDDKYMSAEFLIENGIVSQLIPITTPQLNGVSNHRY